MMQNETITFQLATHYLPKVALRLECLFLTIEQACEESHPVIHHYALKNTIEIIKLIEKPELKSRFLKELMRIEHAIHKMNAPLSDYLYSSLLLKIQHLSQVSGRFGEAIHQDLFLQSIRLMESGPQFDFESHPPQLLIWLEKNERQRRQDLIYWLSQLQPLYDLVSIYLALLRNTAEFDQIDMLNGFYQRSIPSKISCHLILLRMDKHAGIVPKIQLGHHGVSLRLYEASSMNEVVQSNTSVDLALCQL